MRKKPYGRILRREPKEQHLSTIPKFCSMIKFTISQTFGIIGNLTWYQSMGF